VAVRVILQAIGQRANGGGKQYPRRISITAPLLVETRVTWNREAGWLCIRERAGFVGDADVTSTICGCHAQPAGASSVRRRGWARVDQWRTRRGQPGTASSQKTSANLQLCTIIHHYTVPENNGPGGHWYNSTEVKKVKVPHTQLPSVGFRSWSRFLAVSLPVTWVINPAVGCHYFPPGLQLPSQPLRGLLQISLLSEPLEARWVWTVCLRLLPESVATAIWTQALLRLSPAR